MIPIRDLSMIDDNKISTQPFTDCSLMSGYSYIPAIQQRRLTERKPMARFSTPSISTRSHRRRLRRRSCSRCIWQRSLSALSKMLDPFLAWPVCAGASDSSRPCCPPGQRCFHSSGGRSGTVTPKRTQRGPAPQSAEPEAAPL